MLPDVQASPSALRRLSSTSRSILTPPRRKTTFYVAGCVGAAVAGFLSHWIVPAAVKEAPAATVQASSLAPEESPLERRLQSIERTQASMLKDLREANEILGYLKCRSNINNVCPPPEAK